MNLKISRCARNDKDARWVIPKPGEGSYDSFLTFNINGLIFRRPLSVRVERLRWPRPRTYHAGLAFQPKLRNQRQMSLVRVPTTFVLAALLLVACGEPPPPTINLYPAIQGGDLDQIKRHIYWGTDIDQASPRGEPPLHVAVRRGRLIIARELLRNGADPNATNRAGETPLQIALVAGRTQLAAMLLEAGATEDPQALLFILVRAGVDDRDSLAFLTERGADVSAEDQSGATPLHIAVGDGRRLSAKRLIDLGANVDAPDGGGRTPLSIAIENGNRPIIDLLERFGARVEPTRSTR